MMHPAPVDDGGADHLERGVLMPNIALPATAGPAIRLSEEHGVRVFGLSAQTTDWQRDFGERLGLPFALLSEMTLQRALGLPTFSTGGVMYLKRLTLELKDGRIERTFLSCPPTAGASARAAGLARRTGHTQPRG